MPQYTKKHARAGLREKLPRIESFENQFANYEITLTFPEFTCVCPKTNLPDFGTITIRYVPDKLCLEMKSLKTYFTAYRNLGIFQENAVNRILEDVVAACKPRKVTVVGTFNPRGGISNVVEANYPRRARQE